MFIHPIGDGLVQAVLAAFFERPVALLHRKQSARHQDDRRGPLGRFKVLGEALGVDGGRGDDDLQIRPARQQLAQVAQQEVDVQAALMGLVDDDRVVGLEVWIALGFGQQDAVGHQLDRCAGLQPILKAHLVAHHLAQRGIELFRNAFGHTGGRNPSGLGVTNQLRTLAVFTRLPPTAPAQRQRDLGQLGGLARARFATHDDDLMLAQGGLDLVAFA
jgi:hypothetical protein